MITYDEIKYAIQMLDNPMLYLNCTSVHKQIAKFLEVYQRRLEFNGTFEDAIYCLEAAGYELCEERGES